MNWHQVGGKLKVKIGMRVLRADNPTQAGNVLSVWNSAFATVRWENGWKEYLPLCELVAE